MMLLADIFKDICTVKNGMDWCASKTLSLLAFFIYVPMATYMMYINPMHFSLSEFAVGIATIIGAGAVGARIKSETEPL